MGNKISFITNVGRDNLEYLKLLLKSLKENLFYKHHEIIVFIDRDNEGIVEYLNSIKKDFTDLKILTHTLSSNYVGYQLNINILVNHASYDIVSYLQSDMIVSKNYDLGILEDLEENCILSATRIEPPLHGSSDKTFTQNFGLYPHEFNWDSFIEYAEKIKSDKIISYFFAPFTFYKKTWLDIGGHDSIFRRSREDSDILQRFLHKGVQIKQTFKSNVYHFSCVSSRGKDWFNKDNEVSQNRNILQQKADSIELKKFIRKWGSFNHGEEILNKYSCDIQICNLKDADIDFIKQIEPFFEKVWLDDESIKNKLLDSLIDNENKVANKLNDISEKQWDECKGYYNTTNYNNIIFHGEAHSYNCLIKIDLETLKNNSFSTILNNLHKIIENYELGVYEYDEISIEIKNKVKSSEMHIVVTNPKFDQSLLHFKL